MQEESDASRIMDKAGRRARSTEDIIAVVRQHLGYDHVSSAMQLLKRAVAAAWTAGDMQAIADLAAEIGERMRTEETRQRRPYV